MTPIEGAPETVNAWQAFGLIGLVIIIAALLIVALRDAAAVWSFLKFLERWKR